MSRWRASFVSSPRPDTLVEKTAGLHTALHCTSNFRAEHHNDRSSRRSSHAGTLSFLHVCKVKQSMLTHPVNIVRSAKGGERIIRLAFMRVPLPRAMVVRTFSNGRQVSLVSARRTGREACTRWYCSLRVIIQARRRRSRSRLPFSIPTSFNLAKSA